MESWLCFTSIQRYTSVYLGGVFLTITVFDLLQREILRRYRSKDDRKVPTCWYHSWSRSRDSNWENIEKAFTLSEWRRSTRRKKRKTLFLFFIVENDQILDWCIASNQTKSSLGRERKQQTPTIKHVASFSDILWIDCKRRECVIDGSCGQLNGS